MTFFIVCSFTLIFALFATPVAIKLFNKLEKKKSPVPLVGGTVIFLSILSMSFIFPDYQIPLYFYFSIPIFFLGIVDDLYELNAYIKFPAQLLCAILFVLSSDTSHTFLINLGFPNILAKMTCALWIVAITNAFNLTDGINGLLSSLVIVSSLLFFAFTEDLQSQFLLISVAGAALGFLPYNLSRKFQAFLGDSGSLWLGFLMSSAAVSSTFVFSDAHKLLFLLALFCYSEFDSTVAFFRRLFSNRNVADGDRQHIHHLLIKIGLKDFEASLLISVLSGIIVLLFVPTQLYFWAKAILAVTLGLVIFSTIFKFSRVLLKSQQIRFFLLVENYVAQIISKKIPHSVNEETQVVGMDFDILFEDIGLLKEAELALIVNDIKPMIHNLFSKYDALYVDRKIIFHVPKTKQKNILDGLVREINDVLSNYRVKTRNTDYLHAISSYPKILENIKIAS